MVIHVVRAGETLWQISNQYGVDMDNVILLNGLPNPNQLLIGQSLVIPFRKHHTLLKAVILYGQYPNDSEFPCIPSFKKTSL